VLALAMIFLIQNIAFSIQKNVYHYQSKTKDIAYQFTKNDITYPLNPHPLNAEDEKFLNHVQKKSFNYFIENVNLKTGLVMDRSNNFKKSGFDYAPATIAGAGFGLSALIVGAERGWISKQKAENITLNTLKYALYHLENKNGFFYHFMDMKTARRVWKCELSSIDTALFIAGVILAMEYYENPEIKNLANHLYCRIDWKWMTNSSQFLSMGWSPEKGFIPHYWKDYAECMILYIMAMGAPENQLDPKYWQGLNRQAGKYGQHTLISCPPLFTHQYSHIWIDFQNKNDGYADYFYNSIEATLANRQFCLDSAKSFPLSYHKNCWGLTACIGPLGYMAYGAKPGSAVSDGTVAPTAAGGSIVFTPQKSIQVLKYIFKEHYKQMWGKYGFSDSMNLEKNWFAKDAYAINQGPILLMIENLRTRLIWNLFMKNRYIQKGMNLAKFKKSKNFKLNHKKIQTVETKSYFPHLRPSYNSVRISEQTCPNTKNFNFQLWSKKICKPLIIDKNYLQIGINNQKNYKTETFFFHNSKYLFICGSVYDKEIVTKNEKSLMHLDDAVEIYIDSQNDNFNWGGERDFQIILSPPLNKNGQFRAIESFKKDPFTLLMKTAYKPMKNQLGYKYILCLPRQAFGIHKKAIGLTMVFHNIDEKIGSDCKLNWFYAEPGIILGKLILK
jgi:hypothetical protein